MSGLKNDGKPLHKVVWGMHTVLVLGVDDGSLKEGTGGGIEVNCTWLQ